MWTSALRAIFFQWPQFYHNVLSLPGSLFLSFNIHLLPNFSLPWDLWGFSAPAFFFINLPASHLAKSLCFLSAVFQWWNVFLLLPSLSHPCLCLSAWGLWDCGRAALPWQRALLPNCVHLGLGVSLLVVSLPPIYSTFLSGFLWCSRGYQHPSLSFPSLTPHSLSPSKVLSHT